MTTASALFEIKIQNVALSTILGNACRLNPSAFVAADDQNVRFDATQGTPFSDYANVFTVYLQSPLLAYVRQGPQSRAYLTTSELGEYQTRRLTHVSLVADPRLIEWEIQSNYLLISRSGRVGEVYASDSKLVGALVGDCFRVEPKCNEDRMWLYAFLKSPFAVSHFVTATYGSVVEHASVEQVRSLIVPPMSNSSRKQIGEKIKAAFAAREDSYALLGEADIKTASATALPPFPEIEEAVRLNVRGTSSGLVPQSEIVRDDVGGAEIRLDAHHHNPIARAIVEALRNLRLNTSLLGCISSRVILGPRFKRNYVEADHGVPFLSGRNTVQMRPTDIKYLSHRQVEELGDILIERGWTLVTCSGTIGRTCFVWDNYEGYAASQHILRVVPNDKLVDPGYLYAFLSSPYGYEQILRFRHGSVIDEITDEQIKNVLIPLPSIAAQNEIGDLVRAAYAKRAEALHLEDEAQELLMNEVGVRKDTSARATACLP